MKRHMTWVLLVFAILAGAERCAAWIPDDLLVRQERSVEISIVEQEAQVRIRSRFHNPTTEVHSIKEWFPVVEGAQDVHVFVDAEGLEVVEFVGRARLDALADAAEQKRDVRFFRLAEEPWDRVFRTTDVSIGADETVEIIWEFSLPIVMQGDFYGLEIFLDDGVQDELFQLEFSLATLNQIRHFWSPFFVEATIDRSQFGIVALQQRSEFLSSENLRVIWSNMEDPVARFYMEGYEYIGHFRALSPAQYFPRVTVLLDGSGSMSDVWLHVQELLRFLLEHQENRTFRVAITGSEKLEWIAGNDDLFEENTSQLRQKILEAVAWETPLGKGDIMAALSQAGQPKTEHLLMVFSDEEEIELIPNSAPLAVLQFFPKEKSSKWKQLTTATRGVVQQAFRSIMGTHEAEKLLDSIEAIREPLFSTDVVLVEGEIELLPERFISQSLSISPLFVGRVPSGVKTNTNQTWFEWFPRYWASARIAEELERGKRAEYYSTGSLDAILAVARTFGIHTSFFTSETTRDQLHKSLLESDDMWSVLESLWKNTSLLSNVSIRFVKGIPLWKESDSNWRSFNFRDRVTPEKWVKIAPFSAAQRQLFLLFPEIFAEPFGVSERVEFCTEFKCFSVLPHEREEALSSDRAFIKEFNANHWALPFMTDLIMKNILKPDLNGELDFEKPVSRGDFACMLVIDSYGTHFQRTTLDSQFTDVLEGEESFDAIQFLANMDVVRGYEDGTFQPKKNLSRAEAVKILLAADDITPEEINPTAGSTFSDTIGWERPWVEEAVQRGIVSGYGDGTFRPHEPLSLAAAAKIIVQGR